MADVDGLEINVDHKQQLVTMRVGFVEVGATRDQALTIAGRLLLAASALDGTVYTIVQRGSVV